MQSNAQVTPGMIDLGVSIMTAVQAILDDPTQVAAALKERDKAFQLSEEEEKKAVAARKAIAQAAKLKDNFDLREQDLVVRESTLKTERDKLQKEQDAHAQRATDLGNAIAQHAKRETQLAQDQKIFDARKKDLEVEIKQSAEEKRVIAQRLANVLQREKAIADMASKIDIRA